MAQYRLSAQPIQRSKGHSAVAAAAYRSGERLKDERTGEVHDFTRKGGVLHAEILFPENAPDWNREALWNAVEKAERRKDGQPAREIQLSLPHELTHDQRVLLVRGFVRQEFVSRGMVADFAVHAPPEDGDQRNHHAHILLTTRELTKDGFGNKTREWNDRAELDRWRRAWADRQNRTFERMGLTVRVDHRSFEDQSVDRVPQVHLGKTAHQFEKDGERTRLGDLNRQIEEENRARAERMAALTMRDEFQRSTNAHDMSVVTRPQRIPPKYRFARAATQLTVRETQFEDINSRTLNALQDKRHAALMDLDRKYHAPQLADLDADLERRNGVIRKTIDAEVKAIETRLEATGARAWLRRKMGNDERDRQALERYRRTLQGIENREREERENLQRRQEAERRNVEERFTISERRHMRKFEIDRNKRSNAVVRKEFESANVPKASQPEQPAQDAGRPNTPKLELKPPSRQYSDQSHDPSGERFAAKAKEWAKSREGKEWVREEKSLRREWSKDKDRER